MLDCLALRKNFGGVVALEDFTLRLPNAGLIAIMGPNGAGKTTLFDVLSGFLKPDAGKCLFKGRDITKAPSYVVARLGISRTFQNLRIISRMSLLDHVRLSLADQRADGLFSTFLNSEARCQNRTGEVSALSHLQSVGLSQKAHDLAGALSYGEQKLLSLACCFATDAQVFLLDEPVAGVHPVISEKILDLLKQRRQRGKLVVFIEHDLDAIVQASEHLIVMDHGKIIAQGEPREVIGRRGIMEAYVA